MSYPTLFTTPGLARFAEEIDAERQAQISKFGDQHHRDGTGPDRVWAFTGPASFVAESARATVDQLAEEGEGFVSWLDIALEEFAEAAAESDPARLRAELVQVAAVCAAWVADIDSRTAPRCDVEFESGARCSKSAGHWTPENQDPHTPGTTAAEEQPTACAKCRTPFDPADTSFDGRARHGLTDYCRHCVDLCHDNNAADHRCVICA